MKKIILIILALFVLIACSDIVTDPPNSDELTSINKKPPKPDPDPPAVFPNLSVNSKHIAGAVGQDIFIWETGTYSIVWSYHSGGLLPKLAFADVNNDDKKELILIERLRGGKGKNKYDRYYLSVFKEGVSEPDMISLGDFSSYTNAIWDMKIGNVDNDPYDEIVLVKRDRLEIYELNNFSEPPAVYEYGYNVGGTVPWSGEITDYNNDGINEILVAFTHNFWASYQYNGSSIENFEEGDSYTDDIGTLNVVKAADLDNDGNIEVIGGGSSNRLLVWEDVNTIVSSYAYPGDYNWTWALDIVEFDDNPAKEIFFGVYNDGLYKVNYESSTGFGLAVNVISNINIQNNGLIVTDADGSGDLEFIVATDNGLKIYDHEYYSITVENSVSGILEEIICR